MRRTALRGARCVGHERNATLLRRNVALKLKNENKLFLVWRVNSGGRTHDLRNHNPTL